jgi:hypothetical protein
VIASTPHARVSKDYWVCTRRADPGTGGGQSREVSGEENGGAGAQRICSTTKQYQVAAGNQPRRRNDVGGDAGGYVRSLRTGELRVGKRKASRRRKWKGQQAMLGGAAMCRGNSRRTWHPAAIGGGQAMGLRVVQGKTFPPR